MGHEVAVLVRDLSMNKNRAATYILIVVSEEPYTPDIIAFLPTDDRNLDLSPEKNVAPVRRVECLDKTWLWIATLGQQCYNALRLQ
mmetsp:Transcript_1287/g.2832  ORF Transcript_1287/g.2832 Transcript_1287/m.2832 type:complete len:86 (-) Transcript_1287:1301-1558(-)